jgi:uncharacterized membrane protein
MKKILTDSTRHRVGYGLLAAIAMASTAAIAIPAVAGAQPAGGTGPTYTFTTLDNQHDLTFNQLLGINDYGFIAGYFGSGVFLHPNKGYVLQPPYGEGSYQSENYPFSAQTQVTGLNNEDVTVGFWSHSDNFSMNNDNIGFVDRQGEFTSVVNPDTTSSPPVNQLLGINNEGIAAGFYNDASDNSHAYLYDVATAQFTDLNVPGAVSSTATGIDDAGDVSGFLTNSDNDTLAFVLHDGVYTETEFGGSTNTMALGINNVHEVVGTYMDAEGATHGFTWNLITDQMTSIDDPNGVGTTTVNGVNDNGDLVGFYVDGSGNTDGFLAVPSSPPSSPPPLRLFVR